MFSIVVSFAWIISAFYSARAVDLVGSGESSQYSQGADGPNVLIVYANDEYDHIKEVAAAISDGAQSVKATVRSTVVQAANYKRDVYEWADAVVLGSPVLNGNAAPTMLQFINSFDFEDVKSFSSRVGGAFATGGSDAAGLQATMDSLTRGLRIFGFITVGGSNWRSADGTGIVTNGSSRCQTRDLELATEQGVRIAEVAASLMKQKPPTPPTPAPNGSSSSPPSFGETWTASVAANLTQVGYDAGLVIVNFTGQCPGDPTKQKMRTVYGDFNTVLTRCDLGKEFIIDPASRGGGCTVRAIGKDANPRICEACSCPFCTRDTNGTFSHGEDAPGTTSWSSPQRTQINGEDVLIWSGIAVSAGSGKSFDLKTSIAYTATDTPTPRYVNVSHPLWMETFARIDNFSRVIPAKIFDIPDICFKSLAMVV